MWSAERTLARMQLHPIVNQDSGPRHGAVNHQHARATLPSAVVVALRIILAYVLVFFTTAGSAQFITLQGDAFLDENGDPFYPMIMSYYVDYYYPESAVPGLYPTAAEVQGFGYSRSSALGHDGLFAQPYDQGTQTILQDLRELKAQGFNTLRFLSNVTELEGGAMGVGVKKYPDGQGRLVLPLEPPYIPDVSVNPIFWFHCNSILEVCSLAKSLDMKVLLEPFMNKSMLQGNAADPQLADHVSLLEAFATFIHTHQVTNLLGYELFGEPTFVDWASSPVHTKAQICELARSWNQALKQNDPDHLTTIGCVQIDDVFKEGWDPLLLEVDFASVHPYPNVSYYEYQADPATFMANAYDRFLSLITWYDKYLTKPYILSETGLQCQDPFSYPSGQPNPWIAYPWAAYGNEQVQDDFIRAILPVLKGSSRCAGFGWWIMQNSHELGDPPNGPTPPTGQFNDYAGRYYGLLRDGDPLQVPGTTGYETMRKTAAQTLVTWASGGVPSGSYEVPSLLNMDHRYYNPPLIPYSNAVSYDGNGNVYHGTLAGRVLDQFGQPIPGTVVKGMSYAGKLPILGGVIQDVIFGNYTFTDEQGYFELRTYDPLPNNPFVAGDWDEANDRTIQKAELGAHSSSHIILGWDAASQVYTPFQTVGQYELHSMRHREELEMDNVVVGLGEVEAYTALNSIAAHDVLVAGSVDMHARYSVQWQPGFHAAAGSLVHAHLEPVFWECAAIAQADLKSAPPQPHGVPPHHPNAKVPDREIGLDFHFEPSEPQVTIRPNPGRVFQIQLSNGSRSTPPWTTVQVIDARGAVVVEHVFAGDHAVLDMGTAAPGQYTLRLWQADTHASSHPIVVQ